MDNRPFEIEEFETMQKQVIYVSATLRITIKKKVLSSKSFDQGLLDPVIEIRPSLNQIDDLIEEIQISSEIDERVLVTN
jgi:excinuclease ABC subunit B